MPCGWPKRRCQDSPRVNNSTLSPQHPCHPATSPTRPLQAREDCEPGCRRRAKSAPDHPQTQGEKCSNPPQAQGVPDPEPAVRAPWLPGWGAINHPPRSCRLRRCPCPGFPSHFGGVANIRPFAMGVSGVGVPTPPEFRLDGRPVILGIYLTCQCTKRNQVGMDILARADSCKTNHRTVPDSLTR